MGIGAGIVDGLNYGDNTKAAVIRLGLMEMVNFGKIFFPGTRDIKCIDSYVLIFEFFE